MNRPSDPSRAQPCHLAKPSVDSQGLCLSFRSNATSHNAMPHAPRPTCRGMSCYPRASAVASLAGAEKARELVSCWAAMQ